MWPLLVVELEETPETVVEVRDRFIVAQVDVLVLDRPPEALHKDVVCAVKGAFLRPGEKPGRQTVVPAGSARSGSGGNEWAEALREKASLGGQRSRGPQRAVNTEQAPKTALREPTRHNIGEGRRLGRRERRKQTEVPPG
jgi:hypothetical protein